MSRSTSRLQCAKWFWSRQDPKRHDNMLSVILSWAAVHTFVFPDFLLWKWAGLNTKQEEMMITAAGSGIGSFNQQHSSWGQKTSVSFIYLFSLPNNPTQQSVGCANRKPLIEKARFVLFGVISCWENGKPWKALYSSQQSSCSGHRQCLV